VDTRSTAVDSAEQTLELGDHGLASRRHYWAGVALCALGSCTPAAILFGKADAIQERWGPDWILELLAATDTALREALSEQETLTLAVFWGDGLAAISRGDPVGRNTRRVPVASACRSQLADFRASFRCSDATSPSAGAVAL
jgi:hypothetical protein